MIWTKLYFRHSLVCLNNSFVFYGLLWALNQFFEIWNFFLKILVEKYFDFFRENFFLKILVEKYFDFFRENFEVEEILHFERKFFRFENC